MKTSNANATESGSTAKPAQIVELEPEQYLPPQDQ
jgi:hypothetical protein